MPDKSNSHFTVPAVVASADPEDKRAAYLVYQKLAGIPINAASAAEYHDAWVSIDKFLAKWAPDGACIPSERHRTAFLNWIKSTE